MFRRAAKNHVCQPDCIFPAASLKIRAQLEAGGSRKHEIPIFALLLSWNIILVGQAIADFIKATHLILKPITIAITYESNFTPFFLSYVSVCAFCTRGTAGSGF